MDRFINLGSTISNEKRDRDKKDIILNIFKLKKSLHTKGHNSKKWLSSTK